MSNDPNVPGSSTLQVASPLGINQFLDNPAGPPEVDTRDGCSDTDEVETINLTTPDCLDIPSDINPRWVLKLYKPNCLQCDALFLDANEEDCPIQGTKEKCHFNNGNSFCPAKDFAIDFVGMKVIALSRVRKAQEKGPAALMAALTHLNEKTNPDVRDYVLTEMGFAKREEIKPKPVKADDGSIDVSNIM